MGGSNSKPDAVPPLPNQQRPTSSTHQLAEAVDARESLPDERNASTRNGVRGDAQTQRRNVNSQEHQSHPPETSDRLGSDKTENTQTVSRPKGFFSLKTGMSNPWNTPISGSFL